MTRNQELNVLHVKNSTEFAQGINARVVSGDTLIFDFIYFLHPVTGACDLTTITLLSWRRSHDARCYTCAMMPDSSLLDCVQTAIGHWCEMMFPLYSILRTEPGFARPAAQFVLLHLKRSHLMEWVCLFSIGGF